MGSRRRIGVIASLAIIAVVMTGLARDARAIALRQWTGLSDNWVFSDPTNWDGNTPIANGDLLNFKNNREVTVRNDIPGLSLTRLTMEDGFFTIVGDPIQVDDIVTGESGGSNTLNVNLTGIGRTLVAKGAGLSLGGENTFTGQIDVFGYLGANSDKALGSTTGATRILAGGHLSFDARDFGLEPILIEGSPEPSLDTGCAIGHGAGAAFLRNLKASGTFCVFNQAAIVYPNGIQEDFGAYEVFLLSGTHIMQGAAVATGSFHIGGEGTLIWDANSLVSISNAGYGDAVAEGTVIGTGTAAAVDLDGGTFRAGEDVAPGIFTIAGHLNIQNSSFAAFLNGTAAGTGYSQAKVSGPIAIGPETTLDLTLGFTPSAGQSFRIVDNTGNQAVSGIFKGLPEGASFFLGGKTWTITYKGGTGNDVVISTAPPTPPPPSDPRPFKGVMPMVAKNP